MEKKYSFLTERPFAHRGYHSWSLNDSRKIPENSLDAFELAIEKNYSIEMDIHLTKDLELIVFHDFFLGRLTTKTGFVFNKNLNYIKQEYGENYLIYFNNELEKWRKSEHVFINKEIVYLSKKGKYISDNICSDLFIVD